MIAEREAIGVYFCLKIDFNPLTKPRFQRRKIDLTLNDIFECFSLKISGKMDLSLNAIDEWLEVHSLNVVCDTNLLIVWITCLLIFSPIWYSRFEAFWICSFSILYRSGNLLAYKVDFCLNADKENVWFCCVWCGLEIVVCLV